MIDESGTLDADLGPRHPAGGDTPVAAGQAAQSTDSNVGDLGSAPTLHSDEVPAADRERSSLPVKIDRFVILRELGSGGMGVVAEAYDPELDRKIAIKLLRGDRSRPESPLRLLREAQALARLSHPNVVQIHDAGIDDGNVFIAMELVPGQTLGAWLRAERPWREVVDLFLEVGAGLRAAHEQGLVHRDFKPENVLIGADGRPRVVDFGLAREHREARAPGGASATFLDENLTVSGAIMGTPAYMAPEQWRGEEATALSDVFAFSVSLFEALYGQRPFRGETTAALLQAVLIGDIIEPPATRGVPAWLDAVVRRGLAPAPAERFPSMEALLAALARDPGRTLRRVFGLSVLLATVAALGIGIGVSARDREDPCSGSATLLAEVWGEGPRAAVGDAVGAEPLSEELREAVVGGLDRYGDAWVSAHRGACKAHLRGERSDALLDRQMSCLERRRRSIRASTEVIRASEGVALREAPLIVAKLPPIALCEDLDALNADVPPPDPATAAQVAELRSELAELDVLASAGQTDAALAGIAAIRERALALGDPSILAEADLHEGRAALAAYAWERASARLRDALNEALVARRDDLAAEAKIRALYAQGMAEGGTAAALAESDLAAALVGRLTGRADLEGLLANIVANLRLNAGDRLGAKEAAERALAIAESSPLVAPLDLEWGIRPLVAALEDDPRRRDELLASSTRALAELVGPHHLTTLQISMIRADYAPSPAALELLTPVCEALSARYPDHHAQCEVCELTRGHHLDLLGETDGAIAAMRGAIACYEAPGRPGDDVMLGPLRDLAAGYERLLAGDGATAEALLRDAGERLDPLRGDWWIDASIADAAVGRGRALVALGRAGESIAGLEEARALLAPIIVAQDRSLHRDLDARAAETLAAALLAELATDDAEPGVHDHGRAESLLDQAEAYYRDAGPGYERRLAAVAALRDGGPGRGPF